MSEPIRFLRMPDILRETGLSKSEIYRQMGEGLFPQSRAYKDTPKRRYWVSVEVERWKARQIGEDDYADLIG